MTTIGYIHADLSGCLTDDSTIVIDGVTYDIPARAKVGGRLAPCRIAEALESAGYRQATPGDQRADLGDVDADGVFEIRAVKA